MKVILKFICSFILDILKLIFDLLIIFLRSGRCVRIEKDFQSKPVNILANGPSLPLDFDKDNSDYCLLNHSPKSELFWNLRPMYYILCDPSFFADELRDTESKVYSILSEKLDWKLTVFVPYNFLKKAKRKFSNISNIELVPFRGGMFFRLHSRRLSHFLYRNGLALPTVQNVLVGAIGCMIAKGYKTINLYGVDHSWTSALTVNENNVVCLIDSHFYDKDVKKTPWLKVNGEPYKMHECLRDIANMFSSYWDLRYYAESIGVNIVNCSKGSFIDAFQRSKNEKI